MRRALTFATGAWLVLAGCATPGATQHAQAVVDADAARGADAGQDAGGEASAAWDPYADRVVSFTPGPGAGFGEDKLPAVVLGAPHGEGSKAGSQHVVSLGEKGSIVLALDDFTLVDGPGADLLVFENAFVGWPETGVVAVSADGQTWHEWPCAATDAAGGFPGCAGVHPVHAGPESAVDATDPATAGGDAFDLKDVGVTAARFVRVRDSGANSYAAPTGGFDLDAIAVVHGKKR